MLKKAETCFRPITVQPSVFKRASRKRREEVRGAEEVHDDENTVTELPVDQVSSRDPPRYVTLRYVHLNSINSFSLPKRVAETVEDEKIENQTDPLRDTEQVHMN